jgi:undecaprenyl phosphate-alpha-L-ara4FN deformylase
VVDGELIDCPQLPTTLPTLDELIGVDGLTAASVAAHLLDITAQEPRHPHVYTLHAELEGMQLGGVFDALLTGWREQGYTLQPMRDLISAVNREALPRHRLDRGSVSGRAGTLMTQGALFP